MESLGKSQGQNLEGFGHGTSPRDSIHHEMRKVFPHILILSSFWTSEEGYLSANGVPRNTTVNSTGHGFPILVELNPNCLVRNVERMGVGKAVDFAKGGVSMGQLLPRLVDCKVLIL